MDIQTQDTSDRSVGELMKSLSNDTVHLIQQEGQLFRAETSQNIAKMRREAIVLGAGGVIAHIGGLVLVAAVVLLLDRVMPAWLAAFIVGAVLVAAGVTAIVTGRKKLESEDLVPRQTTRSVKEDLRTVREAWR